jgi:transposase-like protein
MRWPVHAVESVRPSRFRPPFCPHPDCRAHRKPGRGFHGHGAYRKPSQPQRRIPRFRCKDCKKTCSRQTFSTSYYLKQTRLLAVVARGLTAGSAHRQIARSASCSKTSVTRIAERLGRHALLVHALGVTRGPRIDESVVHDHFESFVWRQDRALGVGTAVGSRSRFLYDVDPAPHRGGGRRPDRVERGAPFPKRPYLASIRRTLRRLVARMPRSDRLILRVDGRIDYTVAIRLEDLASRTRLEVYPNPKRGPKGSPRSPEAISRDRAMAPVDHLHQLLRHTCADHKRETIAFGRRLESVLGRAHLIAVWKNFIKGRSERKPDRTTPAMHAGLATTPWTWERLLARRLFHTRIELSPSEQKLYRKTWTADAPELKLKHAG